MAISLVQARSVQATSSVSDQALAFTANVTAGSTIIVCVSAFVNAQFAVNACTDSKGQTYTRDQSRSTSSKTVAIFSSPNVAAGATTITVTCPSSCFVTVAIFEFSGLATSAIADVGTTNSGSSTSHSTGTTAATAQADELAIAVDTHSGGTSTPTVSAGWTLSSAGQGLETDSDNMPIATARRILSATGTQSATFTWQNAQYTAAIQTFKGAGGGTVYNDAGEGDSTASGSAGDAETMPDAGQATILAVASGADALSVTEVGQGTAIATGSGADALLITEAGQADMGLAASGADDLSAADAGQGTAAAAASGDDALTTDEAGQATLQAAGSGADALLVSETGDGVLGAVGGGADTFSGSTAYNDAGGAVAALFGFGADVLVMVDAGGGALIAVGGGSDGDVPIELPYQSGAYRYDSSGGTGSIAGGAVQAGPNQGSATGSVSGGTVLPGPNQSSPIGPISGGTVLPVETIYD